MKNNYTPFLVMAALVIIVLLYKSGTLASFITTCETIEPVDINGYDALMTQDAFTTKSNLGRIWNPKIISNNYTYTGHEYNLIGTSYNNDNFTLEVLYEKNGYGCQEILDDLLRERVMIETADFVEETIAPGYNDAMTYYALNGTTYTALSSYSPLPGDIYYAAETNSTTGAIITYTQMPVPYLTVKPILENNPYEFYTPIKFRDYEGKLFNNGIFNGVHWCSKDNSFLLLSSVKGLEAYGNLVTTCTTEYINDTALEIQQCSIDEGTWVPGTWGPQSGVSGSPIVQLSAGKCECASSNYIKGEKCEAASYQSSSSTSTSSSSTSSSSASEEQENNFTVDSLGQNKNAIILIVAVVGLIIYSKYKKKKHGGKKK